MRKICQVRNILVVACLLALLISTGTAALASPSTWNDANFQLVWERTDKPVQDGLTSRSWMWGPETVPGSPATEPYAEAPGGNRVVQYFDKSRMEVNDPAGDRSSLWFVTNGLLVKEMVSGKVQVGNASFTTKGASKEAVAGDPASVNSNAPKYGSFAGIATLNLDHPSTPKTGSGVTESIDKAGTVTSIASPDSSVTYAYFEPTLKHNIPNKLWDFMNRNGLVYWEGEAMVDTVINWVFAMGFPITEAYWTKGKVGGVEKDVLVQLFERRVLTYTPSNSPAYQVEMGNVGQHYYRWRYQSPAAEQRIVFTSKRSGSDQIWTMKTTGGDLKQLTNSTGENSEPRWSPDNSRIVFVSGREGNDEIYVMNSDGTGQQRLTYDAGSIDRQPSWSPDGSRIVWSKNLQIYTMATNGGDVRQVTSAAGIYMYPIYSPDGARLAWSGNIGPGGLDDEVYTANLDGTGVKQLTFRPSTSDIPSDWRDGKILFRSYYYVGGASEVWSMDDDGGSQMKLSGDKDWGARFSPDGTRMVFQRDLEVYVMNADGTNLVNITNGTGFDGQPDWSN